MWEIKLPWKSVVREQTTPQEWFYLISQPTWYPSLHGWVPKGIPPKAGPAVSKTGWPRMKLSLSVSVFGHFFLKFVMALCIWKFWFLQSWGIIYFEKHHLTLWYLLLINWDEVFWDKIPEPDDTSIFFCATAGVRSTQFDFSVTCKLFPTWSDSSSVPTRHVRWIWKCRMSQLI